MTALASDAQTITLTDAMGRRGMVPKCPEKVICSGAGCLRLLTYLQAQDKIAAVDDREKRRSQFEARPYAIANPQFKEWEVRRAWNIPKGLHKPAPGNHPGFEKGQPIMSEDIQKNKAADEMILRPVGVIRSEIKEPMLRADSDDLKLEQEYVQARKKFHEMRDKVAELVMDENINGILDGIEDFSHILVIYWPHLIPDEKRQALVKVHPMGRKELPLTGIFATCSPVRPNPVLVTVVRLLERDGNVLKVRGLDAVDGSPVIDVKPYNPGFYPSEGVRLSEWMEQIHREFSSSEAE